MSSDSGFRASDAEREHVLELLRDAYAAGRITLAEFDERTSAALTSRTWGDLRELTADLPPPAWHPGGAVPVGTPPRSVSSQDPPPPGKPENRGRDRRVMPVVPVALVWLLIIMAAHVPGAIIPILFLLMVGLGSTARLRGEAGAGCHRRDTCGQAGPDTHGHWHGPAAQDPSGLSGSGGPGQAQDPAGRQARDPAGPDGPD